MMDSYWQRQHRIIHPDLARATIIIAGLGTLGSWTAHALAHTGAQLVLFDNDGVAEENVGPQSYGPLDINLPKVDALHVQLRGFSIEGRHVRFPYPNVDQDLVVLPNAVVSCVDTFAGRLAIADWCAERNILLIDTRMGGQVAVVWPVYGGLSYERYITALPRDGDVPPMPCGEEGVAFLGMWVASRVTAILNNWFRLGSKGLPKPIMFHVGEGLDITGREEVIQPFEIDPCFNSTEEAEAATRWFNLGCQYIEGRRTASRQRSPTS